MVVGPRTGQQGHLRRLACQPSPQQSGIPQPGPYPKGHGKTSQSQHPTQSSKQEVGLATSPGVCTLMKFLELVHIPESLLIALYHSVNPALKPQLRWADISRCPETWRPGAEPLSCPTSPTSLLPCRREPPFEAGSQVNLLRPST